MIDMYAINSTDVRKDFSATIDTVIREKPLIVKRTRDYMVLTESNMMISLLSSYKYYASTFTEEDGSITLSLDEIDLMVNGADEDIAKALLAKDILEYAEDYYDNFDKWYAAPNRKPHLPYVMKALLLSDSKKIEEEILCRDGEN